MLADTPAAPPHCAAQARTASQQVRGQRRGARRVAHGGQHEELVAAEAADRVFEPHRLLQRLRQRDQQHIARGVAMRVVERLEAVEVDEEQRHRLRGAGRRRGVEPLHHRAARQRVGERVALRGARQALLRFGELVHVDRHGVDALHRAAAVVEVGHVAGAHPARALRRVLQACTRRVYCTDSPASARSK